MVMSCMETSIPKYEVMKLQTTGKRKKGSIKKIVQRKHKEGSEMVWLENRACF